MYAERKWDLKRAFPKNVEPAHIVTTMYSSG